ncbi:MAG TPA: 2OG-Fe(II) oxygenase family protein [Novosphingobium sp.]|nr:2OG-Fe(II) oxygenase family protein [Novosphingobium sp.]
MDSPTIPVLSLSAPVDGLAASLGESFARFGFAIVADHGIDPALIAEGWQLTEALFALPDAEKRRWFVPELAGARGYTPFGREIAKGASAHALKEFWHVGREKGGSSGLPANLWPERPAGFRACFTALYQAFDAAGLVILSRIARYLGLADDWFDHAAAQGNSVLRLLHYPPLPGHAGDAIRAGAHEDINLITLLLGAEEAGLELLLPDGRWLAIDPPPGALVVNIGDMLQRLTNHVLPSTTHRVRNPDATRAGFSRYSMPFFLHPHSDFAIRTLPGCISHARPDRYPQAITAGDYLAERLREIGLLS